MSVKINNRIKLSPTCSASAWWCCGWWPPLCRWWPPRTEWVPAVWGGCRRVEVWTAFPSSGTLRGDHRGARSRGADRYRAPAGLLPCRRFHQGCTTPAGRCSQTGTRSASGWLCVGRQWYQFSDFILYFCVITEKILLFTSLQTTLLISSNKIAATITPHSPRAPAQRAETHVNQRLPSGLNVATSQGCDGGLSRVQYV